MHIVSFRMVRTHLLHGHTTHPVMPMDRYFPLRTPNGMCTEGMESVYRSRLPT